MKIQKETDCNDQIGLRYISHCVRNRGKTLWTTGGGPRLEVVCKSQLFELKIKIILNI